MEKEIGYVVYDAMQRLQCQHRFTVFCDTRKNWQDVGISVEVVVAGDMHEPHLDCLYVPKCQNSNMLIFGLASNVRHVQRQLADTGVLFHWTEYGAGLGVLALRASDHARHIAQVQCCIPYDNYHYHPTAIEQVQKSINNVMAYSLYIILGFSGQIFAHPIELYVLHSIFVSIGNVLVAVVQTTVQQFN